jgi:PIN domain nuclease of toxin-antitoxin system
VKVLLDTHVFIWSATRKSLSLTATAVFLDSANELYFSLASYWEIAIKVSLGKLVLDANWMQQIDEEMVANSIQWLPIAKEHCQQVTALPHLHGDPFDRLLWQPYSNLCKAAIGLLPSLRPAFCPLLIDQYAA